MSFAARARPPVPEGPYLVVGLARSGQAAARLLAGRDELVLAADAAAPEGAGDLRAEGIEVRLGSDGVELLERVRCVIKSPGVPRQAPAIEAAVRRGLAVIGELELAWRLLPNRFCAVTGTNGKTTVTELLGHVWRTARDPVAVAGNVGTPLASLVGEIDERATVVCECSSFQLEDADAFTPECGVLLNVAADHLDRHGSVGEYLDAKLRLFAGQGGDDVSVYNGSDPGLRGVDLGGRGRRIAFCAAPGDSEDCQVSVVGDSIELLGEPLIRPDELSLIGPHNTLNAMAAIAAGAAMGVDRDALAAALRSFAGVPHRLERVAEHAGVLYVNDSKATNTAAAAAALRSFSGGVRAILGGSPKGGGFAALAAPVSERCVSCYLIGPAAEALERDLASAWEAGVERRRCEDLAAAVRRASADARPGDVVLLAPAAASFDAYRDFEHRGEHFRELVDELAARPD